MKCRYDKHSLRYSKYSSLHLSLSCFLENGKNCNVKSRTFCLSPSSSQTNDDTVKKIQELVLAAPELPAIKEAIQVLESSARANKDTYRCHCATAYEASGHCKGDLPHMQKLVS